MEVGCCCGLVVCGGDVFVFGFFFVGCEVDRYNWKENFGVWMWGRVGCWLNCGFVGIVICGFCYVCGVYYCGWESWKSILLFFCRGGGEFRGEVFGFLV